MAGELITYDRALEAMRRSAQPLNRRIRLSLDQCAGTALAEPLSALDSYPRFDNSEVDGYAVGRAEDATAETMLEVLGTIPAGGAPTRIPPGKTARVLTGGPLPPETFGVIMQEHVSIDHNVATLCQNVVAGAHIRRQGDDFKAGDWLLGPGHPLGPGAVALLASQGYMEAPVFDKPQVGIIATGDELVGAGRRPEGSQIRDTNSPMLRFQVASAGGVTIGQSVVKDSQLDLTDTLLRVSNQADLVLIAGGVSVGERDYVPEVVSELGEILFRGVAIRPGRPLLMGRVRNALVFGLPGNPASSYVCFEIFVRETIRKLAGWADPAPAWIDLPFRAAMPATDRDDFVRARLVDGVAEPVGNQRSFGLRSLAECSCLVHLPAGTSTESITRRKALMLSS